MLYLYCLYYYNGRLNVLGSSGTRQSRAGFVWLHLDAFGTQPAWLTKGQGWAMFIFLNDAKFPNSTDHNFFDNVWKTEKSMHISNVFFNQLKTFHTFFFKLGLYQTSAGRAWADCRDNIVLTGKLLMLQFAYAALSSEGTWSNISPKVIQEKRQHPLNLESWKNEKISWTIKNCHPMGS